MILKRIYHPICVVSLSLCLCLFLGMRVPLSSLGIYINSRACKSYTYTFIYLPPAGAEAMKAWFLKNSDNNSMLLDKRTFDTAYFPYSNEQRFGKDLFDLFDEDMSTQITFQEFTKGLRTFCNVDDNKEDLLYKIDACFDIIKRVFGERDASKVIKLPNEITDKELKILLEFVIPEAKSGNAKSAVFKRKIQRVRMCIETVTQEMDTDAHTVYPVLEIDRYMYICIYVKM